MEWARGGIIIVLAVLIAWFGVHLVDRIAVGTWGGDTVQTCRLRVKINPSPYQA
jgi:hypothetical protein